MADGRAIAVRKVGPGDEQLFARIANEVFDEPVVPDRLRNYLADAGNWMIVAVEAGEIVGQCAAVIHPHPDKATELYLDEIGVTPRLQRQGIARLMINHLLGLARDAGIDKCWVGADQGNVAARGLYEAFGGEPEQCVFYYLDY